MTWMSWGTRGCRLLGCSLFNGFQTLTVAKSNQWAGEVTKRGKKQRAKSSRAGSR